MPQMIIANRLTDGRIVFLAGNDQWVRSIDEGLLLDGDAQSQYLPRAQQHEAECRVVDPNLIEVTVEDGRRRPIEIREAIRAFGPSLGSERD